MTKRTLIHFLRVPGAIALAVTLASAALTAPQQDRPAVDPAVDKALQQMSASLAAAKALSFECYSIREQVLENGQKVESASNEKVAVKRPNGAAASVLGDDQDFQFVYDGKTMTMFNRRTASYGQAAAPDNLDDTLDTLATKYGVVLPLADFLFADPYKSLTGQLRSAQDLGVGYVFETKCRHFAFRQASIDWQLWLEDGPRALPRKLVITYKDFPAQLQYTAYFTKWDLAADLPAATFVFTAPADAKKVEFSVPTTQPAAQKP